MLTFARLRVVPTKHLARRIGDHTGISRHLIESNKSSSSSSSSSSYKSVAFAATAVVAAAGGLVWPRWRQPVLAETAAQLSPVEERKLRELMIAGMTRVLSYTEREDVWWDDSKTVGKGESQVSGCEKMQFCNLRSKGNSRSVKHIQAILFCSFCVSSGFSGSRGV